MKALTFILTLFAFCLSHQSKSNIAVASFSVERYYNIQVFLNGTLMNASPKNKVLVNGKAGRYQLVIKVFDQAGCLNGIYEDFIVAAPGFHSDYKLSFAPECPEFIKISDSRIYGKIMRRPDDFYKKTHIA